MEDERFDAGPALAQLKRFQRRTVDYVFDRLHGADPVRQFLVADEVGLGKTMVARGVIAKTIEALWDRSKRIDILYICSNQAIAAQNLNRLNVLGKRAIGALRGKLSHACVSALKPDLIILDEFQRFRELLRGEGEPAELARALFEYSDDTASARTLLLSATPYRMLTLTGDEPEDGDHYEDFLETIEFLYGRDRGADIRVELDREMRRFRNLLQQLPTTSSDAKRARNKVQRTLKRVMARTERVGSTVERDSMLAEPAIDVPLAPVDLHQAEAFARVDTCSLQRPSPMCLAGIPNGLFRQR